MITIFKALSKKTIALFFVFIATLFLIIDSTTTPPSVTTLARLFFAQIRAGLGVTASVPKTSINALAEQLRQKESALALKERELELKRQNLNRELSGGLFLNQGWFIVVLIAIDGVFLAAFITHVYLDLRKKRRSDEFAS